MGEGAGWRLMRRVFALAALAAGFAALLALSPALGAVAAVTDLVQRSRFTALRTLVMSLVYLACEIVGVLASGALWLRRGDAGRFLDANFRLQWWWCDVLFSAAVGLFGLRVEVTGAEAARGGPVFVLARHVSIGDTILAAALLSRPYGLRLRYVLKRELLRDPCFDIVGRRLPNAFVRRGSRDTAGDVAAVRQLARALGERDGVMIFPEGTRASPELRARAIERLEASNAVTPEQLAGARRLARLLPPRVEGVLALLEEDPRADVVFLAHEGFDRVRTFADLRRGGLVGRRIRVRVWRCPRAEIPGDREGRVRWLYAQWQVMDDWVGAEG